MSYKPGATGGGVGKIGTSTDVALNSLAVKDALAYNAATQKWTNMSMSSVTLASSTTSRPSQAGACIFTEADPAGNALPGDLWLSPVTSAATTPATLYDQQFTGVNGSAWDGFDLLNTLGGTGGLADQQNGDGRIHLNDAGDYSNRVTIRKTMEPTLDGTVSGAFRVPSTQPDIAVAVFIRGSGSQPNYQAHPATSYYLSIHPAASRMHFYRQENEQPSTVLGENTAYTMAADSVIRWKLQAIGDTIKAKTWKDAEVEPEAWTWQHIDSSPLPAGIDGVGIRGSTGYNGGDTLFVHLTRTSDVPKVKYIKKRNSGGTWDTFQLVRRTVDGQWK